MDIERDGITATLKDGFLTITLPRRQRTPAQTRTIPIEVVEEQ
jgi:HSP20 family molecular chaperone IbpA